MMSEHEDQKVKVKCLFSSIKLVFDHNYVYAHQSSGLTDEPEMVKGGGPAIDAVSCGWNLGREIVTERIKAYWFTFNQEDHTEIKRLSEYPGCNTPEFWVREGFAVVSH